MTKSKTIRFTSDQMAMLFKTIMDNCVVDERLPDAESHPEPYFKLVEMPTQQAGMAKFLECHPASSTVKFVMYKREKMLLFGRVLNIPF